MSTNLHTHMCTYIPTPLFLKFTNKQVTAEEGPLERQGQHEGGGRTRMREKERRKGCEKPNMSKVQWYLNIKVS